MRHLEPRGLLLLAAMLYKGLSAAEDSSSASSAAVVPPVPPADYVAHVSAASGTHNNQQVLGVAVPSGTVNKEQTVVTPVETVQIDGSGGHEVPTGIILVGMQTDGASGHELHQNLRKADIRGGKSHARQAAIKYRTRRTNILSKLRRMELAMAAAGVGVWLGNLAVLTLLWLRSSGGGPFVHRRAAGKAEFQRQIDVLLILTNILLPALIGLAYVWAFQYVIDGVSPNGKLTSEQQPQR